MNVLNIPDEMKAIDSWVCVGYNKIPIDANTGKAASSVNPKTWSSFDNTIAFAEKHNYENIGFVFSDNGLIGIDIDDCFEDGFLTERAIDIINTCGSYTEKSVSGTGIHIILKGDMPLNGMNNREGVEIYKASRYFVTTGKQILFKEIIHNQIAIDYVMSKYFNHTKEGSTDNIGKKIYTPVYAKPSHTVKIAPNYPEIKEGCRNISLTSLAGQMHTVGYDKGAIYKELLKVNGERCKPPLNTFEIENIVKSITRYDRSK